MMKPRKNLGFALIIAACFLVATVQFLLNFKLYDNHDYGQQHQQLVEHHLESFVQTRKESSTSVSRMRQCGENDDLLIEPCCASWNKNMDDWWLHHPDFYVSHEDSENFCFSPIQDKYKAEFFRQVHNIQWNHNAKRNCSNVLAAFQTNAGYSASINQIVYGFWSAYQQNVPFQITKHRAEMEWMFAPKNEPSWAYCPSKDMNVSAESA